MTIALFLAQAWAAAILAQVYATCIVVARLDAEVRDRQERYVEETPEQAVTLAMRSLLVRWSLFGLPVVAVLLAVDMFALGSGAAAGIVWNVARAFSMRRRLSV